MTDIDVALVRSLEARRGSLERRLRQEAERHADTERVRRTAMQRLGEAASALGEKDAQVARLSEEVARLEGEVSNLLRRLDEAQEHARSCAVSEADVKAQSEVLAARLEATERQVTRLLRAADDRRDEIDQLRAEQRRLLTQADEQQALLTKREKYLETNRTRAARLRTDLTTATDELARLTTALEALERDRDDHATRVNEATQLIAELEGAREDARSRAAAAESRAAEAERAHTALSDELERVRARAETADMRARADQDDRRALEIVVEDQAHRLGDLERELQAARVNRANLARELAAATKDAASQKQLLRQVTTTRSYRITRRAWHTARSRGVQATGLGWILLTLVAVVAVAVGAPALLLLAPIAAALAIVAAGFGMFLVQRRRANERAAARRATARSQPAQAGTSSAAPTQSARRAPAPSAPVTRRDWISKLSAAAIDPRELVVAAVLDDVTARALAPECQLVAVSGHDVERQLEEVRPDLLLVESAWHGNEGAWQYRVAGYPGRNAGLPELEGLVRWCRRHEVPTVFWLTEGAWNLPRFADAAQLFDAVAAADPAAVDRLEALTGRPTAHVPLAVQPRLHNPITPRERDRRPAHVAELRADTLGQHRSDNAWLLDLARDEGLVVYERAVDLLSAARHLSPDDLAKHYRHHRVFIDVGAAASPTMCTRTAFEALASGAVLLSAAPSAAADVFGDLVSVAQQPAQARALLAELGADDEAWRVRSRAGIRDVFATHTYGHRIAELARLCGFDVTVARGSEIAVGALIDEEEQAAAVVELLNRQSHRPHEVVVGRAPGVGAAALGRLGSSAHVRVIEQEPSLGPEARTRELATLADAEFFALVAPDAATSPHWLADAAAAAVYTDADLIAPAATVDVALTFSEAVDQTAAVVRRTVVARHGWPHGGAAFRTWQKIGVRSFATDVTDPR